MKAWTPEEIRAFRQELNLYQKDLASFLRVTTRYVSMLETGVRKPSETMKALLDCLEKGKERG